MNVSLNQAIEIHAKVLAHRFGDRAPLLAQEKANHCSASGDSEGHAVWLSSRSRSIETPIETRDKLHELALELIRTVFPPQKGIRLVGVTLSNFRLPNMGADAELPFREI